MSLINCPECGKEFSNYAPACPNCGCPINDINAIKNEHFRIDDRSYNNEHVKADDSQKERDYPGFIIENTVLKKCLLNNDTKIVVPKGITRIEDYAFSDCKSAEEIFLPEGITVIGSCSFENLCNLISVVLQDGLVVIGMEAFSFCDKLEKIALPNGIQYIAQKAFYGCASLTSINIPNSILGIGKDAFPEQIKTVKFDGNYYDWNYDNITTRGKVECDGNEIVKRLPSNYSLDDYTMNTEPYHANFAGYMHGNIDFNYEMLVTSIKVNWNTNMVFLPNRIIRDGTTYKLFYKSTIIEADSCLKSVIVDYGVNALQAGQNYEDAGEFDGHIFVGSSIFNVYIPIGMKFTTVGGIHIKYYSHEICT